MKTIRLPILSLIFILATVSASAQPNKWKEFSKNSLLINVSPQHDTWKNSFLLLYSRSASEPSEALTEFAERRWRKALDERRRKNIGKRLLLRFTTRAKELDYNFQSSHFLVPVIARVHNQIWAMGYDGELRIDGAFQEYSECYYPLKFSSDEKAEEWQNKNRRVVVDILVEFSHYTGDGPDDNFICFSQPLGMCIYDISQSKNSILFECYTREDLLSDLVYR